MEKNPTTVDNIKILSVVWFRVLPANYGGQKGTALFNEHIAQQAVLLCICSENNQPSTASYPIVNTLPITKLQFLNPFCWRQIYKLAKKENITHLVLEYPYYGFAAYFVKKFLKAKVIIHEHNIEFIRFRELKKLWAELLRVFEKRTLMNADLVMVKTAIDRNTVLKEFHLASNKVVIVPYGAERKLSDRKTARNLICSRYNIDNNTKILLFAGTLDYEPNAHAVEEIYGEISPRLKARNINFKFIICGRNKSRGFSYLNHFHDEAIINAGEADDIENYFAAADALVDPVLSGCGVQTKIIDALSFNLNVVCFKSKAVISDAGNKIFTAEDGNWDQFTNVIEKAIATNSDTPVAFFEKYNWKRIAQHALFDIKNC